MPQDVGKELFDETEREDIDKKDSVAHQPNIVGRWCEKERSPPSQDQWEPKRELCHYHGDRPLVDSSIPMPTESPRGIAAIIMEFCRRIHLI